MRQYWESRLQRGGWGAQHTKSMGTSLHDMWQLCVHVMVSCKDGRHNRGWCNTHIELPTRLPRCFQQALTSSTSQVSGVCLLTAILAGSW